jgi:cobalamin biosynthesis protein CobD/CbiB
MDAIFSPLAFFALVVAQCSAVMAVHAMNHADEATSSKTPRAVWRLGSERARAEQRVPGSVKAMPRQGETNHE